MKIRPLLKLSRCICLALATTLSAPADAQVFTTTYFVPPPPPDKPNFTSVTNFAGHWTIDSSTTAQNGNRAGNRWSGLMTIQRNGVIEGSVLVSTFAADTNRSKTQKFAIAKSSILSPLVKIGEFSYVTKNIYIGWAIVTNRGSSSGGVGVGPIGGGEAPAPPEPPPVIKIVGYTNESTTFNTNTVYQADINIQTTEPGVEGKGWAKLSVLSGLSVFKDGLTGKRTFTTNKPYVQEAGIDGLLWCPTNLMGGFFASRTGDSVYWSETEGGSGAQGGSSGSVVVTPIR